MNWPARWKRQKKDRLPQRLHSIEITPTLVIQQLPFILLETFHYDSTEQKDESDGFTFDELDAKAMYLIPQFCMIMALSKPAGIDVWRLGSLLKTVHRLQILVWTGVFFCILHVLDSVQAWIGQPQRLQCH